MEYVQSALLLVVAYFAFEILNLLRVIISNLHQVINELNRIGPR
jgi:hypothetical protein